jgi:hypothetical protein
MENRTSSVAVSTWSDGVLAHSHWRDVLSPPRLPAFFARAASEGRTRPVLVLRGTFVGWAVLLVFFGIFGPLCNTAAYWVTGWTREYAYATWDWGPFYIAAAVLSCAGFLLSGYAVARSHRQVDAAAVFTFAASVFVAIAISVYAVMWESTPVNHTWFFVMWTALPSTSYAGFVLNPALVLGGGWLAIRSH